MLSSHTIRTLTLLLIGAVFLNIALYMVWWFHFQQLGLRYNLRKFYETDDESKESNIFKTEEYTQPKTQSSSFLSLSPTSYLPTYTMTVDMANMSNTIDENLNYGTTRTPEMTTDTSSALVVLEKRKVRRVLCHEIPRGAGLMPRPLPANTSQTVRNMIAPGGYFKFVECRARQRIAVLITLRYGEKIKEKFFLHMHTFLIMQESEYHFFVIAQNNTKQADNQGRLINVGFMEVRHRFKRVHCFIVHESTVLPLDSKNLYRCTWYPRQLAVAVENTDKSTFYPKFGYAVALTTEQFSNANGFTNGHWTHKSGYENMYNRLIAENYVVERSPAAHGKYFSIGNRNIVTSAKKRTQHTTTTAKYAAMLDGLSTLAYTVACYEKRDLYTYISVTFPEDSLTGTSTAQNLIYV